MVCGPFQDHCASIKIPFINSLWASDTIWRHRTWSTLAQVMACCLTAPSHYLNQCWLIISKVLWHSSEDIPWDNLKILPVSQTRSKIAFSILYPDLPGVHELRYWSNIWTGNLYARKDYARKDRLYIEVGPKSIFGYILHRLIQNLNVGSRSDHRQLINNWTRPAKRNEIWI